MQKPVGCRCVLEGWRDTRVGEIDTEVHSCMRGGCDSFGDKGLEMRHKWGGALTLLQKKKNTHLSFHQQCCSWAQNSGGKGRVQGKELALANVET